MPEWWRLHVRTEVHDPRGGSCSAPTAPTTLLFDLESTAPGTRDYKELMRGLTGLLTRRAFTPEHMEPSITDDLIRIERVLRARSAKPGEA
ncbi:hypothetical protein BH20ACT19_BH20ACT19_02660 [soil metagenome]